MNSLIFSVCMLFQVSDDTVRGSATGFFYTNSDQLYLITNRHVVAYSENDTTAKLGFNLHTSTDNMRLIKAIERSEEHTSELQSLMRISYAVFCLNKKKR